MSSNYRNSVERMTLLKLQTKLDREVCANCPFSSPHNQPIILSIVVFIAVFTKIAPLFGKS